MKRNLIYLFCVSITLQSMLGQFLLLDHETDSIGMLPSLVAIFSARTGSGHHHFLLSGSTEKDIEKVCEDIIPANDHTGGLRFERDSTMEHLFSPFNCPNKTAQLVFITFSYLYVGNFLNLFAIEEKINNFIIFYSELSRIIRIGLPITKLIYPFHSYY